MTDEFLHWGWDDADCGAGSRHKVKTTTHRASVDCPDCLIYLAKKKIEYEKKWGKVK